MIMPAVVRMWSYKFEPRGHCVVSRRSFRRRTPSVSDDEGWRRVQCVCSMLSLGMAASMMGG
jgi:hypothetical protein